MKNLLKTLGKNLLLLLKVIGMAFLCWFVGFIVFALTYVTVMELSKVFGIAMAMVITVIIAFVTITVILTIIDVVKGRKRKSRI